MMNLNEFEKAQMKMMEHDDLDKFMTMINKNKPSVLQVMKDEIAEDESNHFLVENRKLREILQEIINTMDNGWHSTLDCFIEGRNETCPLCKIVRKAEEYL
jgi:hypothetical protein